MARDRDDDRMDDDYDDRPRRTGAKPGGMDGFMGNIAVAIVFAVIGVFCCPCISIILGGVGMATCKTPEGKKGSTIALVGGVLGIVLNLVLRFVFKFDPMANFNK